MTGHRECSKSNDRQIVAVPFVSCRSCNSSEVLLLPCGDGRISCSELKCSARRVHFALRALPNDVKFLKNSGISPRGSLRVTTHHDPAVPGKENASPIPPPRPPFLRLALATLESAESPFHLGDEDNRLFKISL